MPKCVETNVMYIDDIFASIQGESTDAGKPCVFLRLFGCNIGCSFCDQQQNPKNRRKMSIGNVVNAVTKYHIKNICITGGEPLLQWNAVYPLVLELKGMGYNVSIETSGCVPIEQDFHPRGFKYVMDIKCPSSGVSHRNVFENLLILQKIDEVKFVISNREDYLFAKNIMYKYPTQATILFSPCFDDDFKPLIGKELVDWVLADRLLNVRFQIQMHKCMGVK